MTAANGNVPIMLTVKQAAEEFNQSEHFIRRLVKEKKIVFVLNGVKVLINRSKFVEFLNGGA